MKKLFICLSLLLFSIPALAQKDLEKELSGYVNPDELISLSEYIPFNKAVEVLSRISEKNTGKTIVSTVASDAPIGVEIVKLPYKKALNIIVQYANLIYEEKADAIIIKAKNASAEVKPAETYASVNSREVKISAVIFEADVAEMKSRGINWQYLLSQKNLTLGMDSRTFSEQAATSSSSTTSVAKPQDFNISAGSVFNLGNFTGNATAIFKFFETENMGEIIASPSVAVRNNQTGRIQIGSDYSIKQKDFSGNIIDKFFSTGSIVEVTPNIYNEENIDYILLNLSVERSSATPSEISTEIRKTSAKTQVLMLNGEETVIGGLYINEETNDRTGIPFLKDLPWWVFGIRYLTGSEVKSIRKKEVVILIKADLLPTLKERMTMTDNSNKIKKEVENHQDKIKFYQFNQEK